MCEGMTLMMLDAGPLVIANSSMTSLSVFAHLRYINTRRTLLVYNGKALEVVVTGL